MSREWKPGDVALARIAREVDGRDKPGDWSPVIRDNVGTLASGVASGRQVLDHQILDIRPLVVIDPEDREAARVLIAAVHDQYKAMRDQPPTERNVDAMQQALREFTNPTPPKPEEPTGLGAVVEDADGVSWVRWRRAGRSRLWRRDCAEPTYETYADIAAVRVLSEGVQR